MRVRPPAWTGRADGPRWHHVVGGPADAGSRVALLGFASDEGVARNQGRIGAAAGPAALRGALANLAAPTRAAITDLGDVTVERGDLERAQTAYAETMAEALAAGSIGVGMGGGHEIAYASFVALKFAFPNSKIGILNVDAHFDLRDEEPRTSGTSFLNALNEGAAGYRVIGISRPNNTVKLFETARERGVTFFTDGEARNQLPQIVAETLSWAESFDRLYMTVCLDVLPASEAPGVSAPAALGVPLASLEMIVAALGKRLSMFDVAELNPRFDVDGRTARAAARLIWTAVEAIGP